MSQWAQAAVAGRFDFAVLTRDRARDEGYDLPDERHYLGIVRPNDGRDSFAIGFLRLENVATFVKEMTPLSIAVRAAGWEDPDALREALADLALSGATVQ